MSDPARFPGASYPPYPSIHASRGDEQTRAALPTGAGPNRMPHNPMFSGIASFSHGGSSETPISSGNMIAAQQHMLGRQPPVGNPEGYGPGMTLVRHVPTASTAHMQTSSSFAASSSQNPYEAAAMALRKHLDDVRLTVLPNRCEGYNWALMTMMLQLKGVPTEEAERTALTMHAELASGSDELGLWLRGNNDVYEHPAMFQALTQHIFREGNVPPVMLIMMALDDGTHALFNPFMPLDKSLVRPSEVPPDTAMLFKQPIGGGRFEAVVNNSGCPWPQVLEQLRITAAHGEEDRRITELVRHALRSVRKVTVNTIQGWRYEWKRGMQTGLEPALIGDQNPSPPLLARQMAEAQALVDDFWFALENRPSTRHEVEPMPQGIEIYRLRVSSFTDDYAAELQLRNRRILRATIDGKKGGGVIVWHEDPSMRKFRSRTLPGRPSRRERLTHDDDYDVYDEFATTSTNAQDRRNWAGFLTLQRNAQPQWDVDAFISKWSPKFKEAYDLTENLRNAVGPNGLYIHAPPSIVRALGIVSENRRAREDDLSLP